MHFPFIDYPEEGKVRPALALTEPIGKYRIVIVAFITSKIDDIQSTTVTLSLDETGYKKTGLTKTSYIVLHKLTAVVPSKVIGEIGTLPEEYQQEVKNKLKVLLSL